MLQTLQGCASVGLVCRAYTEGIRKSPAGSVRVSNGTRWRHLLFFQGKSLLGPPHPGPCCPVGEGDVPTLKGGTRPRVWEGRWAQGSSSAGGGRGQESRAPPSNQPCLRAQQVSPAPESPLRAPEQPAARSKTPWVSCCLSRLLLDQQCPPVTSFLHFTLTSPRAPPDSSRAGRGCPPPTFPRNSSSSHSTHGDFQRAQGQLHSLIPCKPWGAFRAPQTSALGALACRDPRDAPRGGLAPVLTQSSVQCPYQPLGLGTKVQCRRLGPGSLGVPC